MAVQGDVTFSIFTYQCDLLRWTSSIGNFVGLIVNGTFYENHPLSMNASVVDIDCSDDAVSGWTNVVYRIDDCKINVMVNLLHQCCLICCCNFYLH